jgi:hypothetical protein
MPFIGKLLPLLMNEFTSDLFAVIASVSMSDIDRNNTVTVNFSTDPFGPSFPETIIVSGIHPKLGLDLHYNVDRHHCHLIKMAPGTPSHILSQWKSRLRSEYMLYIDMMSVHTIADVRLIVYEGCSAKMISIVIAFMKDDTPNCLAAVGFTQLYLDQLRIMRGHIKNTVITLLLHLTETALLERLTLSEWIQLDNYAKQNMCGAPRTAHIDASIFFWVWLYSIKPQKIDHKKVRGVCDGSTYGGKTMVHGATYAPTPQHIGLRLQITLSALLVMLLWHTDVTNAFAESDRPEQIYPM